MRASTLYVLVAMVGLSAGLYSLPRWVVQNKTRQLGAATGGRASGTSVADSLNVVANTGTKDESSVQHNQPLTPAQQKQVEGLQRAYASATPAARQSAAERLITFFRSASRFDSAAHYAGIIAQLTPSETAQCAGG